ncbi:MAG TPA: ScpA family protein [Thermomicrobiales bacterium]|nr:ScpA family protein [Thermomicrobiales bacterium]
MSHPTAQPGSAPSLSGYQLRLPAFEGPLDVLLRLIERNRLPIEDVSLVTVSEQFLDHVRAMEEAPPAVIAEFAAIGARLTVLKSRSLLPRPTQDDEEPEQSDLTMRLREYQQVKLLASRLDKMHQQGWVAHAPATGSVLIPGSTALPPLAGYDVQVLVRSLRRRLSAVPRPATFIRQRRVVSIREAIDRIAGMVGRGSAVPFGEIVAPMRLRTDVATTFLAVLVMIRRGSVVARQDDLFGEVRIEAGPGDAAALKTEIDEFTN